MYIPSRDFDEYDPACLDDFLATTEPIHGGLPYTVLHDTFNLVRNPDDWRGPIDVVVPAYLRLPAVASIEFFTGASVSVTPIGVGHSRIFSAGSQLKEKFP